MPRGVGGRGLAEIQGFEIFIHKVKIFVHTPSFRKFSTSCSTVFTCSAVDFTCRCSHPIIVQIYILYTCCILYQYHTLQKITKNCKLKRERERERENPGVQAFRRGEVIGVHLPPLVLPALVPTCSNSVYARACLCSCLLLFMPIPTYCLFAPVRHLYPFAVHACSSFMSAPTCWPHALLVIQFVGHVHSFGCAFVCADAHCHSHPLLFTPAVHACCCWL